jgi:hypothetical protein
VMGACVCDPRTCAGCCDDHGVCQDGTSTDACGGGGARCAVCQSGSSCTNNACEKCGWSNCTGCCSNNYCVTGDTSDACGTGGAQCVTCSEGSTCGGDTCF